MPRRSFSQGFKEDAVKLVVNEGYSCRDAAHQLGVGKSTLIRWVESYSAASGDLATAFPGKGNLAPKEAEFRKLQRELERTKRERDILKKALGYFANPRG